MPFDAVFQWLQDTSLPTMIREGENLFPWIEAIHVVAITLVVGTISMIDLRLLGFASMNRPVGDFGRSVLICTWGAFAIALVTGGLLFSANAVTYANNFMFQCKMVFLGLAGVNMAFFHAYAGRAMHKWGAGVIPPLNARLAGAMSLALWIIVIGYGRWIGFTLK
jgi:hypothetical protein